MPKLIKNIFYSKITFINFINAHKRASIHKQNKKEVIKFEIDLETNIANLINNIKNDKYCLGKYRVFTVHEPKERTIKSLPYVDRVVHQWYIEEFIKPYMIPRFIKDSYACIEDRGSHKSVYIMQKYMRKKQRENKNYYILKCDIKKFFDSINKNILFEILNKYIKDEYLLKFTRILIFDGSDETGIPIGNYTSQYFANIYLNELDQYVKHDLKIKYYVRYMDDFVLLLDNKEEAKLLKNNIAEFLNQKLKLTLNAKSRYYPNKMGVDFCGYKIFTTHKLIRTRCKTKMKKLIKKWNIEYRSGQLAKPKVLASINSWGAHIKHSNSYNLKNKILSKIDFNLY